MILDHYITRTEIARLALQAAILGVEYDWYAFEEYLRFELLGEQRATDDGMPERVACAPS